MQFSTLSVALFAALASAHVHHPQHYHHRRQINGTLPTSSAEGAITTPSVPLGTGKSGPAPTSAPSGDVVLTYTLGTGSSTTVVTTTIKHTSTETVYATLPAAAGESSGPTTAAEGDVDTERTTTLSGTSTSTRYITVSEVSSAQGALASGGAGGCVPVTVTVALSTVTVTETAAPTGGSLAAGAISSLPAGQGDNVESASATDSPVVILSTQTVVPVPVLTPAPFANGTVSGAVTTSGVASSGFLSKRKPSPAPSPF